MCQAVVWSDSGSEHSGTGDDHVASWKAFSVPLELTDSVTAVDFAPVSLPNARYTIAPTDVYKRFFIFRINAFVNVRNFFIFNKR